MTDTLASSFSPFDPDKDAAEVGELLDCPQIKLVLKRSGTKCSELSINGVDIRSKVSHIEVDSANVGERVSVQLDLYVDELELEVNQPNVIINPVKLIT